MVRLQTLRHSGRVIACVFIVAAALLVAFGPAALASDEPGCQGNCGVISGVVVDDTGQPVADLPLAVFSVLGSELPALDRLTHRSNTSSDADGTFRVEELEAGAYAIQVGYVRFSEAGVAYRVVAIELPQPVLSLMPLVTVGDGYESEGVVVTVARLARISGTVWLASGPPAARQIVRLLHVGGDASTASGMTARGLRQTGSHGGYSFIVDKAGSYRISARWEGDVFDSDPVRVAERADVVGVDLVLGNVVDEDTKASDDDTDVMRDDVPPPEPYVRATHRAIVVPLSSSDAGRQAALRLDVALVYSPETGSDEALWERLRGTETLDAIRAGLSELPPVERLLSTPDVIEIVGRAVSQGVTKAGFPTPVTVRVSSFVIQG